MEIPKFSINVLDHPDKVSRFWEWFTHRPKGYVACDIETGAAGQGGNMSELRIFDPGFHVRMMQFGDAQGGWAIPFQEWKGLVKGCFDWVSENRVEHVWHNGFGFDAQALRQEGIVIDPTCMWDTQVLVGLGGFAGESRRLKPLARRELGEWATLGQTVLDTGMKNAGWTWTTVPMDWKPYPMYGVVDTIATAMLYEKWEPWRKQFGAHHNMEIAASVITNQMARTGMMVDGEYLANKINELVAEEDELLAQSEAQGWGNPANRAEVARVLKAAGLLDLSRLTPGGQVSIDKKQLRNIEHPLASLRLQYMFKQRMRKDYLEKIFSMIGYELAPGVIHPSIWSMAAKTSRMSVSAPPLQQLPANDHTARQAFIPDNPDHVLIGADFAQIEMRTWAIMNNDQLLKDMFNQADATGQDFFVLMARDLYNEPNFQKSDPRRGPIKNTAYATIYAGGDGTIAETAGLPLAQVQPTINALKKRYSSFADAGQSLVTKTSEGIFEAWTPNGRRFRVREYKDKRVLPNWCGQGWAATILKNSAIGCRAAGLGDNMRLAVHDELIFSVPRVDAKDAAVEIEEIMNSQIDPEEHGVRIYAKANIGSNWAELK